MRSLWLILILLSLNYSNRIVADETKPSQAASGSFGHNLHSPEYKIEFHSEDSHFHPDDEQESVIMPNKKGEKFLCYLPREEKVKSGNPVSQQNTSSMVLETEKQVKLKTPDDLLQVLKGQCFARQEGWWMYDFCYQKKLSQVHVEDEKVVQEFVLGLYDAEATAALYQKQSDISILKDPRSKDASKRYHAHVYTNGTLCDLTNQPRETEVRFVCAEPRAMINSITELSTCKYALTVQCPTLCKHPLFYEERPVWHTINCNALPKDYREEAKEKGDTSEDKPLVTKQVISVPGIEHPFKHESEEYAT